VIYVASAILCALSPSIVLVIAGRFVQGLGGGLLFALAYVLVRNVFPEPLWPRVFGLLAGVWSVSVLAGPLIGGSFAGYGNWRVRSMRSREWTASSVLVRCLFCRSLRFTTARPNAGFLSSGWS